MDDSVQEIICAPCDKHDLPVWASSAQVASKRLNRLLSLARRAIFRQPESACAVPCGYLLAQWLIALSGGVSRFVLVPR